MTILKWWGGVVQAGAMFGTVFIKSRARACILHYSNYIVKYISI
jgi:hypothetical protein